MKIDIFAEITELRYRGERSCVFVIKSGPSELVCTVTYHKLHLAPLVKEGREIILSGTLKARRRFRKGVEYVDNILYVEGIEVITRSPKEVH